MSFLLDVNVLLALAWPNHVHHSAARSWFAEFHNQGWLTCSITESGFIRVSSNPRVTPDARTPGESALLLHRICQRAGHNFLADSISLAKEHGLLGQIAHSSSHVTDTQLVLLAHKASATFVTFDRQAAQMAQTVHASVTLLQL